MFHAGSPGNVAKGAEDARSPSGSAEGNVRDGERPGTACVARPEPALRLLFSERGDGRRGGLPLPAARRRDSSRRDRELRNRPDRDTTGRTGGGAGGIRRSGRKGTSGRACHARERRRLHAPDRGPHERRARPRRNGLPSVAQAHGRRVCAAAAADARAPLRARRRSDNAAFARATARVPVGPPASRAPVVALPGRRGRGVPDERDPNGRRSRGAPRDLRGGCGLAGPGPRPGASFGAARCGRARTARRLRGRRRRLRRWDIPRARGRAGRTGRGGRAAGAAASRGSLGFDGGAQVGGGGLGREDPALAPGRRRCVQPGLLSRHVPVDGARSREGDGEEPATGRTVHRRKHGLRRHGTRRRARTGPRAAPRTGTRRAACRRPHGRAGQRPRPYRRAARTGIRARGLPARQRRLHRRRAQRTARVRWRKPGAASRAS